jgi:hypothetical protein
MKKIISAAALSLLISAGAMAQTQTQSNNTDVKAATPQTAPANKTIHEKQENQQQRIGEGVENGSLTPKEAKHLENREADIQKDKKEAKSDGTISKSERKEIKKDQKHASKAIYHQKHDTQHMNEPKHDDNKKS